MNNEETRQESTKRLSDLIAPVYKDFFFDMSFKHYILTGGRSSSKGDSAYTKAISLLISQPGRVLVYVPIQSTIRDGVFEQVLKVAKRMGVECTPKVTAGRIIFNEGTDVESDIVFKGLAMDNSKKKDEAFKGIDSSKTILLVIFDELASLDSQQKVDVIVETVSRNTQQIIYIWNPPRNKNHWLFDFRDSMKDEDDVAVLHTTVYDLPSKWVESSLANAERTRRLDKTKWEHAYMGLATGLDDVAFPVDIEDIMVDFNELNGEIESFDVFIDNGQKDATVFALYGITFDKTIILLDTYYHSGRLTGQILPDSTYVSHLIQWEEQHGINVRQRYCDSISFQAEAEVRGLDMSHLTNKHRVTQYNLARDLVLNNQFKVLRNPNNEIFLAQFQNAELEYKPDKFGLEKPCIAKVDNRVVPEKRQIHALDTFVYCALINYNDLRKDVQSYSTEGYQYISYI